MAVIHALEGHSATILQELLTYQANSHRPVLRGFGIGYDEAVNFETAVAVVTTVVRPEHQMRSAEGLGAKPR